MLIKIKPSECRGIYVTNLSLKYKYQLFIPWTIFARLRLWKIESQRTILFFFLSHKGTYVEGTEWHWTDHEAWLTLVLSLPSISFISLVFRRPQSEIVPKQLHDQGAVFVGLFIQCVQFSNCFIKCLQQRAVSKEVTGSLNQVRPIFSANKWKSFLFL